MSNLSPAEIKQITDIIEQSTTNGKGFVWNFTNDDFKTFVLATTDKDIYDKKYETYGNSKIKRLKRFLEIEEDFNVKRLLEELKKYGVAKRKLKKTNRMKFEKWIAELDNNKVELKITDDSFKSNRSVKLIINNIERCIKDNNMCMAVDRLHTLFSGYIKYMCNKNKIETTNKPLESLYSEYLNKLYLNKKLPEGISKTILSSSKKIMKDFDNVRNNMSPSHFNKIISNVEAEFLCIHIINLLNFLMKINTRNKKN